MESDLAVQQTTLANDITASTASLYNGGALLDQGSLSGSAARLILVGRTTPLHQHLTFSTAAPLSIYGAATADLTAGSPPVSYSNSISGSGPFTATLRGANVALNNASYTGDLWAEFSAGATLEGSSDMGKKQRELDSGAYRALDLTDDKGFFCGKLLGDLGADVIKI